MIEIRQATIADKQSIFLFLKEAYKDMAKYKLPERWEWEFENNPYKQDNELPVWIAVDDHSQIVGQICVMKEPLKIGDRSDKTLSWAVDLIVLPDYREQKIGFRLTKAIYDSNETLMALPMSEAFRHYMTKLGSVPVASVSVFKRLANFDLKSTQQMIAGRINKGKIGKLFVKLGETLWLDHLITACINLFSWFMDLRLSHFVDREVRIEQVEKFDQLVDELWESVSSGYPVSVRRDSEFLNWKYVQQPFMDYQKFMAFRGQLACGYLILRHAKSPESNSGIIADLLVSKEDTATLGTLLAIAARYLKRQKVKYIFGASSIDSYKREFSRMGFKVQKDVVPLFHHHMGSNDFKQTLVPNTWFLGRSDHDWDQFPYG